MYKKNSIDYYNLYVILEGLFNIIEQIRSRITDLRELRAIYYKESDEA